MLKLNQQGVGFATPIGIAVFLGWAEVGQNAAPGSPLIGMGRSVQNAAPIVRKDIGRPEMTHYKWKYGPPKTALVTGAASGLGQRFCQQLLSEGVKVAAFDRGFDTAARHELQEYATSEDAVRFYAADIVDHTAIAATVAEALGDMGAPDLLLHCAGISEPSKFDELSHADFTRTIDINLHGTRNVVAAVLPYMVRGSHIVLTASLAGITANYAYSAYSASKFGVVGLTEVLRMEMVERGIDVSSLCPAEIVTPMVHGEWAIKDPIRTKLKAFAGSMERDPACELIMRAIAARKPRIVPGFRAQLTSFLTRVLPGPSRRIARQMIQQELHK